MKKYIIIALVSLVCSIANAADFFTIGGQKISLHEKQSSFEKKLDNSNANSPNPTNWGWSKSNTTATFDKWGLSTLSTDTGSVTIDGKTIVVGKDTPNTIKAKLQNYCHHIEGGPASKSFIQTTRVGAEGEINIIFTAISDGGASDKALANVPISTLGLSYEDPLANPTCNH